MCFYIVVYSGYYLDLIKVNRSGTYYHLQTKFAKVMFLHVFVCPGGVVSQHALQQVSLQVSRPTPRGGS